VAQRVLVVDDDRSIVKVLRGYLEKAGYKVLTAFDGDQALYEIRMQYVSIAQRLTAGP
jgi:DNA-binding response OmpR family regulator